MISINEFLILSIYQIVSYIDACMKSHNTSLYTTFSYCIQPYILWWNIKFRVSHKFLKTAYSHMTSVARIYIYTTFRCYVRKTNFEVIKGTCHVEWMIEETMEISWLLSRAVYHFHRWMTASYWCRKTGFNVLIKGNFREKHFCKYIS